MGEQTAPRIYGLTATAAPVVAVFTRGPSDWSHVGRWDLARGTYEPGGWLRGRLFPRRSDLSPDGRWLCYFAHKPGARWEHGETYVAVSKLPWLTALHAFGTDGTWTRGYHFIEGRPTKGEDGALPAELALPIGLGLAAIPVALFANERRRGWQEAPDCPPRDPKDMWDERRNARMSKQQPSGERVLHVESAGSAGGEFGVDQAIDGLRVCYALENATGLEVLEDLQWADWDATGRLLVATRDGRIQTRDLGGGEHTVVFDCDLSTSTPAPTPSPPEARRW